MDYRTGNADIDQRVDPYAEQITKAGKERTLAEIMELVDEHGHACTQYGIGMDRSGPDEIERDRVEIAEATRRIEQRLRQVLDSQA